MAFGLLVVAAVVASLEFSSRASVQPLAQYGPKDARILVSFGARPSERFLSQRGDPNRFLEDMTNSYSLYVAKLGYDSNENVSMSVYPHALTAGNVHWFIHYNLFGFHAKSWDGYPGAEMDVACRVGDTNQTCPGRTADRDIIVGNVIYELDATGVSASEVARFFGSFRLVKSRRR